MSITLQFAGDGGLSSGLIEWYGHDWCSHVDCVLPDGHLLGARIKGGVAIRPPHYRRFRRVQRVTLPCPGEMDLAFRLFAHAQVGKPYDWTAIAAFAFDRDWREGRAWFCSELVAAGLARCGYFATPLCTPARKVTPGDLRLALSARVKIAA